MPQGRRRAASETVDKTYSDHPVTGRGSAVDGALSGRQYLAKRGLSSEVITRFAIGYAPPGWDNVLKRFGETVDKTYSDHPVTGRGSAVDGALSGWVRCLLHKDPARQYLAKRGLSSEVITRFAIGYAPPGWDNVLKPSETVDKTYSDHPVTGRGSAVDGALSGWVRCLLHSFTTASAAGRTAMLSIS
jgi:hypothetical protein